MKEPWVALGGRSRKESTREEVLLRAKAERAARGEVKQQQRAATTIQAAVRGHACRSALQQRLVQEWQRVYAPAAAQPDVLLPAEQLQCGAVRLMLMAVLPPASRRSSRLLASGHALQLGQAEPIVRGTVALVLRSLSSQREALNYMALATHASSTSAATPASLAWRVQAAQLCQVCCLVTAAAPAPDPVLDAATARLLQLLTPPPPSPAADALAGALLAQPMPLLSAVRRCIQQQQQQRQQQQEAQGVAQAGALSQAAGLQRLMAVVVSLLESCSQQPRQPSAKAAQAFREQLTLLVLAAPGLVACLSDGVRGRLLAHTVMVQQLLPTAQQLGGAGRLTGPAAAHCLVNLAQLLVRAGASSGSSAGGSSSSSSSSGSSLADGPTAEAYVRACMQLLVAAQQPTTTTSSSSGSSACCSADVLQQGLAIAGAQAHLLQLRQALVQHSPQGEVLWAGYCVHLLQDSGGSSSQRADGQGLASSVLSVLAFAPGLLPSLWQWLARTAGLPLEAPLQASRGLDIAAVCGGPHGLRPTVALVMGLFCRSLSQLLLVLDDADLHQRQTPFSLGASRAIASTLNSLVFHTFFPEGARTQQQQQQPGQQQARAHTAQHDLAAGMLPVTFKHGLALLHQCAPTALRGYYDRDARKSFCQPNLWTEPFSNMMARLLAQLPQQQDGGVLGLTAAVVQALLVSTGLADEADAATAPASSSSSTGVRPNGGPMRRHHDAAAMGAAAQGASIPGLRTSSLLALLRAAPQCVPFNVRLELFRQLLQQDKVRGRWLLSPAEGGPRPIQLTVRRDVLLEDAFAALRGLGAGIKARLMVTFVNAQGLQEAGLDHGGLTKELLEQVVLAATQPNYGLFAATEDSGLLYTSPAAEAIPQGLALLEFVGLMVGKALYEGILLNLVFAPFFLRCLQGGRPGLDDLAGLDSTLHANLVSVKACPADHVEHLGLTFAAEQQLLGRTIQTNLLPGGDNIAVTAANRLLYVHLLADWHLNARLGRGATAFASGLSSVLPASWLRMFSPSELNQLISGGADGGLDMADMARYVQYSNGYSATSHTVKLFWSVVAELTGEQRGALLRFVTSSSRAPLGGFRHLQPPLTIHKVDCAPSPLALLGGKDVERLPSASTCFHTLKLPNYRRRATLKQKLLQAIGSGAGFELS